MSDDPNSAASSSSLGESSADAASFGELPPADSHPETSSPERSSPETSSSSSSGQRKRRRRRSSSSSSSSSGGSGSRRSRSSSRSGFRKFKPLVIPTLLALLLGLASLGVWGWVNAPPVVPPPTLVSVLEFNEAELPPAVRARLKVATAQHQQVEGNDKSTLAERGRAWRLWGEEFLIANLWSQGAACLQNAAALRPDEWQDRYLLAMALRQSDDLPAAKTAMESALALMERPPKKDVIDRVNAWCFLASIALKQQNPEEALRPLDKALELDSRCVYALFERGRLHCQNDLLEEALKDLGAANRLYPDSAPIRAALLDVHTKRKNEFAARQFAPRPTTNPRDAIAPESPDRLLSRVLADDKPSK